MKSTGVTTTGDARGGRRHSSAAAVGAITSGCWPVEAEPKGRDVHDGGEIITAATGRSLAKTPSGSTISADRRSPCRKNIGVPEWRRDRTHAATVTLERVGCVNVREQSCV